MSRAAYLQLALGVLLGSGLIASGVEAQDARLTLPALKRQGFLINRS